MWVCDGIKLSVGRTFDPVVFLWLWTDTLYSSMFTSMQLVGLPSKQHQHPKIASDGIPNGKWRDVRWIIQQSTGVLVDIIGCWEGIWHRYPKYFHFVYSSYGKYTTQHSHHDSGDNIWLMKTGDIIHIAQGYHHRIFIDGCCCLGWHTLAMNELVFNVIPGRELL